MSLFANVLNTANQAANTAASPSSQNVDNLLNAATATLNSAANLSSNVLNNALSGASGLSVPSALLMSPANTAISSMLSMVTNQNFNPAAALNSTANLAQIGLTSNNLQSSFSQIDTELRKLEQAAPGAIQAATNLAELGSAIANDPGIQSAISLLHPQLGSHIGDFATHMSDAVQQYNDYNSYANSSSLNPLTHLGRMGNQFQMKMALNGAQSAMNDITADLKSLGL